MSEIKTSHYKIRSPLVPSLAAFFPGAAGGSAQRLLRSPAMSGFCRRSGRRIPGPCWRPGDMVVAKGKRFQADAAVELLGELTRRYPVFYANGNHEDRLELKKETFGDAYQNYMEEIQSPGRQAPDEHQPADGDQPDEAGHLRIPAGLEVYRHGCREEMTERELTEALGEPDPDVFTISAGPPSVLF